MTTDRQSMRYAAHLPLNAVGGSGQARISEAHIVLIGVGGLGCPTAQYLVSSGIGRLTLCDFDTVAESNLARQILFRSEDIGLNKVDAAKKQLNGLNPDCQIDTVCARMGDSEMLQLFQTCDLVIDASDNYGTRLAVNRSCLSLSIPWVMGACVRMEGQVMLLRPDLPDSACYRCSYGQAPDSLEDCPGAGIFAPVAGIVGTTMAHMALGHIAGLDIPSGLLLFDAADLEWRKLLTSKAMQCPDCGPNQ